MFATADLLMTSVLNEKLHSLVVLLLKVVLLYTFACVSLVLLLMFWVSCCSNYWSPFYANIIILLSWFSLEFLS